MDRETYTNSRVVDLAKKLIPVKLNVDKNGTAALSRKYGVEAIPTIIFTDASGKILRQFVGFKPPDEFVTDMQAALKKTKK